jgi:signal transduction histidine kinase
LKSIIIILFTLSSFFYSSASELENQKVIGLIKSLEQKLSKERIDSNKVPILLELSDLYSDNDKKKSISFASRAFKISKKQENKRFIYISGKTLGDLQCDIFDYDSAISSWNSALLAAISIKDLTKLLNAYDKLGEIAETKGDYSASVNYFLLGLGVATDNKIDSASALMNYKLGKVNILLENEEAINYLNKSLEIYIALEDYYMIAKVRFEIGNWYLRNGYLIKAKENYILSNQFSKYLKDKSEMAFLYEKLASVYYMQDSLFISLDYFTAALGIASGVSEPYLNAVLYNGVGRLSIKLKEYESARDYFIKALRRSLESGDRNIELDIYKNLALTYKMLKKFKQANEFNEKYILLRESLFSNEKSKIIANSLAKHRAEEKEKENELLRQKKKSLSLENEKQEKNTYILVGAFVFVFFIALLLFRNNKIKQKVNNELSQKNIQIEKQRSMLENLNDELVGRNEEIELINLNLMESESQLIEANASKDKFFSLMAHDIKNPISGFIISSDLLVNYFDKLEKGDILEKIKKINFSAIKLRDLLENILTWARSQTGAIEFNPEKVEIKCLAGDVCDLFSENVNNKNLTLENHILNEEFANVDKYMIETVIRNLVSNAIKFTPEGGTIKVLSESRDDLLIISVEDNGVGIPSNRIDDLFKITNQYSTNGTQNEKGTGLGLIMCKEFIEHNGGEISVESKKGEGTKFSFSIKKY